MHTRLQVPGLLGGGSAAALALRGAVSVFVRLVSSRNKHRSNRKVGRGVEVARFVQGRRRRVSLVEPGWSQRQAKAGVPWTWLCSIRGGGVCVLVAGAETGCSVEGSRQASHAPPGPTAQLPAKQTKPVVFASHPIFVTLVPTIHLHGSPARETRNNDQQGPDTGRRQFQYSLAQPSGAHNNMSSILIHGGVAQHRTVRRRGCLDPL